jgi:uncharacterized protein YbjT (DUF2867 family)
VLRARDWRGVELAQADALAPDTLPAGLTRIEIAFYLVHSMASGARLGALDLKAAENFVARAAAQAGVRRLVYLGGLVPQDADSEHLVRRETGDRLRAHAVPVTEIRTGIIVGPGSAACE